MKEDKILNLEKSFEFLKDFPIANYKIIKNEKDLENIKLDFPVYLKISIGGHKLILGGIVRCKDKKQIEQEFEKMKTKFPDKNFIIQEEVKGEEFIIGIKTDEVFGKMLMLGFGGSQVEETKNVVFRTAPTSSSEIKKMLQELKTQKSDKLISLAEKVSKLQVQEIDLNPVIVNNKEAIIVDARICLF